MASDGRMCTIAMSHYELKFNLDNDIAEDNLLGGDPSGWL